jgi:putative addiction module killer protein
MLPLSGRIRVEEYVREDGSVPYRAWFDGLDAHAAAKVVVALVRLSLGNTSNVKWFSGIGEYVLNWGPGYRVYLAKDGEALIVLLGGGTKSRQDADIERAKALHAEYKSRKARATRAKPPAGAPATRAARSRKRR